MKKRGDNDQTRVFKRKYELLKISTSLQTESAAETHLAVGQWLEEQPNIEKFNNNKNKELETKKAYRCLGI
jgi:hypothetical protein